MNRDRIEGRVQTEIGRSQADYGRLADDHDARLAGSVRQAEGLAQEVYGQAKDGVRDAIDRASAYAEGMYDEGRRQVERGAVTINQQVESKPVLAILVAAAAGYIFGLAYRARRR